ncbi:hypothetical protein [Segetibacter koreensis]|uniref:hypothetical protein n=1 Tax=Segetibacter koreensis TaxID=398037 RepID=UPI00036A3348|nr:hypothetical protein [Segetibacter koreensis]
MKKSLFIWLVFFTLHSIAQDSVEAKKKLIFSGYVKDLQSFSFNKDFTKVEFTNLVHNRINLKWKPSKKINGSAEIRNRFFLGDGLEMFHNFKDLLRNQNEAINLSETWVTSKNAILHSNIERLSLEYRQNKWNIRAGRQRINWGMANTWNPNDIFNTYNFLDFDYEERPGSDAVKYEYLINDLSKLEIAAAAIKSNTIAAARYFTNYKGYDFQLVTGFYANYITAGCGWAGSISGMGFKGETQFYKGLKDSLNYFNLTIETDYIFQKGWYLSGAVLYNQNGLHNVVNDWSKISFQISPHNLMPSRWSLLLNSSKEFTPLFSGSMSIVYSPQVHMLILFPSFKYNLLTNLDVDLVCQSFFAQLEKSFQSVSNTAFVRLKWTF